MFLKKTIAENQTLNSHMLFFDPINEVVDVKKGKEGYVGLYYRPVKPGVRVTENGDAEFTFYAPNAK